MTLSETLDHIRRNIITYVYPIYFIFGLTGCCLNILLLCRRQFRTVSCCAYFLTASVAMLINLAFGIGTTLYALNNADPKTTILAFCKSRIYILQSTSMMYRSALVAASFDRYASSSPNISLRNFANISCARRIIAVIVCLWLIVPIQTLILYDLQHDICAVLINMALALYFGIFANVFGCILPVLFMILFALLTYRNLILKRQRVQDQTNHVNRGPNEIQHKRDKQVLMMLLIQVFVYIISVIPLMIMYLYNASTINVSNKSINRIAIERFVMDIVEVIIYVFPTVSFYLYAMVSKIFRKEFKQLLRSVVTYKCHRNHQIVGLIQMNTITKY